MATTRRRLIAVVWAGLAFSLPGCELSNTVIPRTDPSLVIHSILDPSTRSQIVLVERSLTGAASVTGDGTYDPSNPIVTGNGVPVSGAVVTLTDPTGLVMTGTEDRPGGGASGVYRISLDAYKTNLQRGGRYALSVVAGGQTVTGTTIIPSASPPRGVPRFSFNRDHEFLGLQVGDVANARAYWVTVQAPKKTYSIFTLDRDLAISGDTRNLFTDDLLHVFYPGFLETMTVAATDTNVYDYYRSGNDPFSGTGLINHLSGGVGLFGSIAVVDQRLLDITQDSVDAIDGRYTLRGGADPKGPIATATEMTLFREALGIKGGPDRISGFHLRGLPFFPVRGAVFGTRDGAALQLDLLFANSTERTNSVFRGSIRGDSLIGTFDGYPNSWVFVRSGK